MAKLASHHAYQRIIGMGDQAIPLLLRELQREVDLWFWALEAITGEDPVRAEHRGNIDEMARDWIIWGKERGYLD